MTVEVRKVTTDADFKAFFEFPWTLYKTDSNWVPPLLSMRRDVLDREKNPSWSYLEGDYYVAWRNGSPVGTIAAFVNHRHNEFHDEHIAWFGFFESIDDPEVSSALLQTASRWAQVEGYDAIRGPQSFTNMEECGLLVDGFEQPILLMPYNPPYYQHLIEAAGFQKVMDTYSFVATRAGIDEGWATRERFDRLVEKVMKRGDITVRALQRKNLKEEFALFKDIYNVAWEKNWGFVPFTDAELNALVESLGMIFDPDLACFAYVGDEPAGFLLAVPDFSQVLHEAYPRPGVPEIISLLQAGWHWKIRRVINQARVPLMGVKEQHRGKGVDMAMFAHTLKVFDRNKQYDRLDCGWILETNEPMIRLAVNNNLTRHRTYRFYERALR